MDEITKAAIEEIRARILSLELTTGVPRKPWRIPLSASASKSAPASSSMTPATRGRKPKNSQGNKPGAAAA